MKRGRGDGERAFCKKLSIYKRPGERGEKKNVEHRTSNVQFRIGKSFNIEGSGLEILSFRLFDFLFSSFAHSPVPRFSPSNIRFFDFICVKENKNEELL